MASTIAEAFSRFSLHIWSKELPNGSNLTAVIPLLTAIFALSTKSSGVFHPEYHPFA
jgi:hypothetical protein